jgi:hypothetical protein
MLEGEGVGLMQGWERGKQGGFAGANEVVGPCERHKNGQGGSAQREAASRRLLWLHGFAMSTALQGDLQSRPVDRGMST